MPNSKLYDDQDERLKGLDNPEWYENTLKDIQNLPETDEPGQKSDQKEASSEELSNQESGVGTDAGQEKASSAGEQDLEQAGSGAGLYKPSEDKRTKARSLRARVTKRNGLIAGVIAAPIITISVFLISFAPNLIINNLRELILNRVSQVQTHHSRSYRRSKINKVRDLFSKDGRLGGRVIADMESRGYQFRVDPNDRNRVIGLTLPDGRSSLIGTAIGDHIADYMEVRHPLRTSRWKTKRTNALYQRFKISRASIVAPTNEAIDDPDVEINKRIAQGSLEGTDAQEDSRISVDEDETDAERAAREEQQSIVNEGGDQTPADIRRQEVLEGIPREASQLGEDVASALDEIGDGVGENVLKVANDIATNGSIAGRVFNTLKGWLDPTNIVDRICTIKNRLKMGAMIGRTTRATALMRDASLFVGVGDAVRRGKVDPKLFNSVMKRVTAIDRNGNPIGASPGIIYALKGKFNKNTNNVQKSRYGVDGSLTGVFGDIQEVTDSIPGTGRTACVIFQNPVTQVGATVVITFGKAIACTIGAVLSFGGSCAAAAGFQAAQTGALTAIKVSIKNALSRVVTKAVLKRVAIQAITAAAAELTFEGIMALTQLYIEKSMALPLTGQEQGAELGSMLVAGGGVSNKQRSLAAGMVPATVDQYAAAEQEFYIAQKEETKNLGFAERYFSTENFDSLVGKLAGNAVMSAPSGSTGAATLPQYAVNFFGDSLSLNPASRAINSLTGNKAYAQSEEEISFDTYTLEKGSLEGTDLAVDFAGNPQVILRSDIEAIDPDENIEFLSTETGADGETYINPETLEPLSQDFTKHIEYCVDSVDILSRLEFEYDASSDSPQKDCLAQKQITVKLKAHLAYLDMLDGLEAEFFPEEVGPSSDGTGANTNVGGASSQYISDCSANGGNAAIACTAIDQLLGVPYSADNRAAADDPSPAFLDCSAFTGMALYRTFGTNLGGICSTDYRTNSNFQEINIKSIQPGDFIGKGTGCATGGGGGHIALVVSYDPSTGKLVTVETDGPSKPSRVVTSKGLQVDGSGNYIWAVRYIGPKSSPGVPGS